MRFVLVWALLAALVIGCAGSGGPVFSKVSVTLLNPSGARSSSAIGVDATHVVGSRDMGCAYDSSGTTGTGCIVRSYAGFWSQGADTWKDLEPGTGYAYSFATSAEGDRQYGSASFRAGYWSGSPGSWTELSPIGLESQVSGARNSMRVGRLGSRAAMWHGSEETYVDLHPTGLPYSEALGTDGVHQAGRVRLRGVVNDRAAVWSGSAESFVNLHPVGYEWSCAAAVDGSRAAGYVAGHGIYAQAALWPSFAPNFVSLNPAGANSSAVTAMSGPYQVGFAKFGGNEHAGIWSGTAKSFYDLNQELPSDFYKSTALAVFVGHNEIRVVGYGFGEDKYQKALMWTITTGSR